MSRDDWQNLLPSWLRTPKMRKMLKARKILVLQVIANRCNKIPDHTGTLTGGRIGYDTLADLSGMGRRTAVRHVVNLMTMGILKRTERGGVNWKSGNCHANVYSVAGSEAVANAWRECQNDTPSSNTVLEGQIGTPSYPRLADVG